LTRDQTKVHHLDPFTIFKTPVIVELILKHKANKSMKFKNEKEVKLDKGKANLKQ